MPEEIASLYDQQSPQDGELIFKPANAQLVAS